MSYTAIRKTSQFFYTTAREVLLLPRVIKMLKKLDTDLYVLKDGFDYWTGKIKEVNKKKAIGLSFTQNRNIYEL